MTLQTQSLRPTLSFTAINWAHHRFREGGPPLENGGRPGTRVSIEIGKRSEIALVEVFEGVSDCETAARIRALILKPVHSESHKRDINRHRQEILAQQLKDWTEKGEVPRLSLEYLEPDRNLPESEQWRLNYDPSRGIVEPR